MLIQSLRGYIQPFFLSACLASVVSGTAVAADINPEDENKLKTIISGDQRGEANAARDEYRHPLEVLKFFGVSDDLAVMEIWPAGGWWTEILAPYLADNGRYVAAHFPAEGGPEYYSRSLSGFKSKLAEDPDNYGKVEVTTLMPNAGETEPVPPGSMDMVLTFRNLHNWMSSGTAEEMFGIINKSLKPGGMLGVVEHRASTETPQDPKAQSGYVREDYAIELIEGQGFKLVAKSEINANPKDTKDYPGGVWTLPPSFREGDTNRQKYADIGESDRFTLLFQKQ